MAAEQVTESTVQGEAANPHMTDQAAGSGQTIRLGCKIEFSPGQSSRRPGESRCRVDRHALDQRQIDHDRAIGHSAASHAVATAAYRYRQLVITCEPWRCEDVVRIHAARNQCRKSVDGPFQIGRVSAYASSPGWISAPRNRERRSWNARRDSSSTASMKPTLERAAVRRPGHLKPNYWSTVRRRMRPHGLNTASRNAMVSAVGDTIGG